MTNERSAHGGEDGAERGRSAGARGVSGHGRTDTGRRGRRIRLAPAPDGGRSPGRARRRARDAPDAGALDGTAQADSRPRRPHGRPGRLCERAGRGVPRRRRASGHPLRSRPEGAMTNLVLEAIRTRRMTRALTGEPIARSELEEVLKAARWAPSAGNRRLHRFIAVQDPLTLKLLRMVSPGMFQRPAAVVVICIDRARAESFGMRPNAKGLFVDVGTAAQTMLLAAHSLGLGAGVVTSFSQAAVNAVLNIPEGLSPEMLICLGHAAATQPPGMPTRGSVTWQSLTQWERFPDTEQNA